MNFIVLLLRLAAAVTSLSFLVLSDPTFSEGFIFPFASDPHVPEITNLIVRNNDTMVVAFYLADTTTVDLGFNCTASVQDAIDSEDVEETGKSIAAIIQGPYENTGKVLWEFDWSEVMLQENLTFCRFILYNETLDKCAWGPWGLLSFSDPNPYNLLYFSPIFQIEAYNATQNKTIWNDSTQNGKSSGSLSSTATATLTNVICPPSGIPPTPTPTLTRHTDNYPPLLDGLQFPI